MSPVRGEEGEMQRMRSTRPPSLLPLTGIQDRLSGNQTAWTQIKYLWKFLTEQEFALHLPWQRKKKSQTSHKRREMLLRNEFYIRGYVFLELTMVKKTTLTKTPQI